MKIIYNKDEELVETIKQGLKRTGGYCPCMIVQNDDTKCICKDFRDKIKNPEFEGYCHCMLYYKEKQHK